jgi:hypothetical protein
VVFCYLVSGTSAILISPTHNSPATTNRPQEAALRPPRHVRGDRWLPLVLNLGQS